MLGWLSSSGLASRIMRLNMTACAVGLLIASALFLGNDFVSARGSMVGALSVQVQIVAANSAAALTFDDPAAAKATLGAFAAAPGVITAGIYKLDGSLLAAYSQAGAGAPPERLTERPAGPESHGFDDRGLTMVRAVLLDNRPAGWVYARSNLGEIRVRVFRFVRTIAIVLLASLLATFLIARRAHRSVSQPMVELARIARLVQSDRDYSRRMASTSDVEEVAALAHAFNGMLAEIGARDDSLTQAGAELERRVQERTAELAAANRELEAFAYSVSHDLRAPLRAIAGFSLALAEDYGPRLDDEARRYIQRIESATTRMGALIDDLLRLGHVGTQPLERSDVDLGEIAREVGGELAAAEPERAVSLEIARGLTAYGDARLLRVVLVNLLGNAWKYSSRHARARIEVGRVEGEPGAFFVKDDGAGFDPAHAAQIFAPFHRLHAEEFAGTGIGLAMVQRIIQRHGGRVWAEAAVEAGATFYFGLPAR